MQDHTLEPRLLVVDDQVRRALVTLRLLEDEPLPVSALGGREVTAIEKEYGCVLPDAVLAAFAANVDALGDDAEMGLDDVFAHTQAARRAGCGQELIAIGRHPDGLAYYCIERRADWTDHPVVLHDFDTADGSVNRQGFGDWLEERVEACRQGLGEGDQDERTRAERQPGQAQLDGFRPLLLPGAEARSGVADRGPRLVHHGKFGVGKVLREEGEGLDRKLEVEFDQVGTKLILARFLEER